MFLSPTGAFEFQAAELQSAPPLDLVRTAAERVRTASEREIDRAVLNTQAQAAGDALLEAFFMNAAARETGADLNTLAATASEEFGISYDYDLDTDMAGARGVPNEAVRFQVGRQSPPRNDFSSRRDQVDGTVVAQLSNGRFEPAGPAPVRQMSALEAQARRPAYVMPTIRSVAPIVSVDPAPRPAQSAIDIVSSNAFDNL
jgi:hypothetical protein